MASEDFEVSPRDIPGPIGRDRDWDGERRIHAPGGSNIVTVVLPGGGGRDGRDGGRDRDYEVVQPATIPLTGTEQIDIRQQASTGGWWHRRVVGVMDFLRSFWPAVYCLKFLGLKADQPLTLLFTVGPVAMVYQLVYSITCVTQDAGASTGTLSLYFTSLDATASPVTQTQALTAAGVGHTLVTTVQLQPGTTVAFKFLGGGTYGTASYNLIVSAIPVSSDQATNRTDNLMW